MFSNFIYLFVALILYSTSEFQTTLSHANDNSLGSNTFYIAIALFLIFGLICHITFTKLDRYASNSVGIPNLDHSLEKSLSRLSTLALLLFGCDLYFLRLNQLLDNIWLFKIFPTIEALVFLALFISYLVVVWNSAWSIQKRYFTGYVSKKSFVLSNISFSLPALLPWFILSITADLIELIPFEQPKGFFATTQGEILYLVIFMVAVACFGPLLIQKIWGCTPLEKGFVRERIEKLCNRANLNYADILKWDLFGGSMITAGVMGLLGKFRYILVTPAMINNLLPDEIDAVIVHEIGHIQNRHIHFYLIFFTGYITSVYYVFDPMLLIYYFEPVIELISFTGINHDIGVTLILSLILIFMFLIYFRYIFGFFMRNFERQADIYVYHYLPDASSLIQTFYKIVGVNRHSWDRPNWHHYSIKERVDFLQLCELNREYIKKHNQKIKLMMQLYIVVIVLICSIGYYFNFGQGKDKINDYLTEKILNDHLDGDSENIDIVLISADYYYNKERFDKAIYYYNKVISLSPKNSHALNNLAWLYATSPDLSFQNPKKALEFATRALESEKLKAENMHRPLIFHSHILDTYAEACFLNGLYVEALEAATEALKNATDKKDYYEHQLKRFSHF